MLTAHQYVAERPDGTLLWAVAESEDGRRFPGLLLRLRSEDVGSPGHPLPLHVRMGMFAWGDVYPVVFMVATLGYVSESWINLAHDDAREWMTLLGQGRPLVLSLVVAGGRIARTVVVPSESVAPTAAAIMAEVERVGSSWSDPTFDRAKEEIVHQYSIEDLWNLLENQKGGNGHGH